MSKDELELFCVVAGLENPEISVEVTNPDGTKTIFPTKGRRADGDDVIIEC